ncbi:cobalt transporter CbiM [Methanococcus voltae]|uniref:cobalt transporter CbiM n=1 Tax=Methanococcus voltae TaxID=2188 RepID=UPI001AEB7228|nr:cobalt transporter CbiM [Methanococcus voltae]MBP2172546.1 cobalt/nickel transport system permease protein [Methanococcus voltae]
MHIPDGFIPTWESAIFWIISIIFVALAIKWAKNNMDEKSVPLFAVLGAGIFAIQAINVPIGMGTSGHMVGAAMASMIFDSPYAGILLLALVLLIQGLFFADGGILVMGANIFNMGVICAFVGYYAFKSLRNRGISIAAFVGGWLALFTSAIVCSLELTIAGTFPLVAGLSAMGLYHAIIGLIEGAITAIVLGYIASARPDMLKWTGGKNE